MYFADSWTGVVDSWTELETALTINPDPFSAGDIITELQLLFLVN